MTKAVKVIALCLGFGLVLLLLCFLPTFSLKTPTMEVLQGERFAIYYEPQDADAAVDVASRLDRSYEAVAAATDLSPQDKTEVYLYASLSQFHRKKYGLLGQLFGPDWYIGDNVKNKVVIVSPNHPGPAHDYESAAGAAVHEYVHTLMYGVNPKLSKFLGEGMAGYVSGNTKPTGKFTRLPALQDLGVSDPVAFGNNGLYSVSYTFVEYLAGTYGMDSVMKLVQAEDYRAVFGKSRDEIGEEWIAYFERNYMLDSQYRIDAEDSPA